MLKVIGWLLLGSGLTVCFGHMGLLPGLLLIIVGAILVTKSLTSDKTASQ